MAFWGGATKQTRVILQYAKTNRGVFVPYNKHGTGRGGQGTHIWNIPSAASAEAAQRLLQPPRARGRHGGRAAGPGAVLGRPTPKPRAATAKPCLRPPPQIARSRIDAMPIHELRHRENLQGSWQCARATCSFCDNTATNLEMTRPIRIWARNNYQATMCYRLFLVQWNQCATHHYTSWFCVTKLAF